MASGAVGTFAVMRERSLLGDAVAHSVLPGVVLGFMVVGDKNIFALTIGALIFGWLSLFIIDYLKRTTKLDNDSIIGMILSVFFGLGIMLLTYVQSHASGNQSGLNNFLFGQAASLVPDDVIGFSILCIVVLIVLVFGFRHFQLVSFDAEFAKGIGTSVSWVEFVISTLMVLTIVAGLQSVGVVLMVALLIMPASAARFWSDTLSEVIIIATIFGGISGVLGSFISFLSPGLPTGPWMVLSSLSVLIFSMIWAPKRGFVARTYQLWEQRLRTTRENLLKIMYKMDEKAESPGRAQTRNEIFKKTGSRGWLTSYCMSKLKRNGFVQRHEGTPTMFTLTESGKKQARRIVRRHRLWESYLSVRLHLDHHHVHEDADLMEHVLNDDLEAKLIAFLGKPETDPHQSPIPYDE